MTSSPSSKYKAYKVTSNAALEHAKKIYNVDRMNFSEAELADINSRVSEFRSIMEKEADRLKLGYFMDVYAGSENQNRRMENNEDLKAEEVRFSCFGIHKANSGEIALTLLNMLQVDLSSLSEEKFRMLEAIRQLYFALEFLHVNGGSDSCQCENCVSRRQESGEQRSENEHSGELDALSFLKEVLSSPKKTEEDYSKFLEEKLRSLQKTDKDRLN